MFIRKHQWLILGVTGVLTLFVVFSFADEARQSYSAEGQFENSIEKSRHSWISESFEDPWSPGPPGWILIAVSSGDYTWHQDTDAAPSGGSSCASVQYYPGAWYQEEFLQTPTMDLSLGEPEIYVSFYFKGNYEQSVTNDGCDLKLEISTDGSTFPTTIWQEDDIGEWTTGEWIQVTVDISAYYSEPTVALWWRYTGKFAGIDGDEFSIDLVEVYDAGPPPHPLSAVFPAQNDPNATSLIGTSFNTPMDVDLFSSSTFVVQSLLYGLIAGVFNTDPIFASFSPTTDFSVGDVITVTLTDGIQTEDGWPLDPACSWTFNVGAIGSPGQFEELGPLSTDEEPKAIGAADFTNDGLVDLVVTQMVDQTVCLMLNLGDGSFTKSTCLPIYHAAEGITVGDFDHDSNMDFACPGAGNSLYIAKGDGLGGFTLSQETGLSGQLHALTSADFDNDGYIDLAGSCNGGPYQIMLLLNDGTGSFTETSSPATGGWVFDLVALDSDNDWDFDIAAADSSLCQIELFTNDGAGIIALDSEFDHLCNHYSICAGNFNDDEWMDIATHLQGDNNLYVLTNNGDGTFTYGAGHAITQTVHQMKTNHFNDDENLDLVMTCAEDVVLYLPGNGDGTFGAAQTISFSGIDPWGLGVADFDNDGDVDIVTANRGSDNLSVIVNRIPTLSCDQS